MKIVGQISRVNGKELTYAQFKEKYMMTNQPVVLTGLMDHWRACHDWVSENGLPNLSFFSQHFGNSKVQVADCDSKEFADHKRMEMTISDYIKYWHNLNDQMQDTDCKRDISSLLYLKDWHFIKEYPEYVAYVTPNFFSDDWLNLYLDNFVMNGFQGVNDGGTSDVSCSDYRFVYMGPKGTWTPLHADVFRSYSWSANICGKKLWHFLSPSQSHLLYDRHMKQAVYDIDGEVSVNQFPGFSKTSWLECIQERNEVIFVPSGWFHQVKNLEDTISINHNWFNAYNLSWVWKLLINDYNETKEYIEDIRSIADDFESLCQRNLAANTGMNFDDFFVFITRIALANFTQLSEKLHLWGSKYGRNGIDSSLMEKIQQLLFNLVSIRTVAENMESIDYFGCCRKEHIFDLQDTALLVTDLGISKDSKIHELKVSLKETCRLFHKLNVGTVDLDIVDGVLKRKVSHLVFEGAEKIKIDKPNEDYNEQLKFFDHIPSVISEDHSTEHYKVIIIDPKHLVKIINRIIAIMEERALVWGCDLVW